MQVTEVRIHEVEPAPVPEGAPSGYWQCASCHRPYRVRDGWKLVYDAAPRTRSVAFICPGCARVAARRAATDGS